MRRFRGKEERMSHTRVSACLVAVAISEPTPNGPSQPAPVPVHSVYRKAS
jgi:hypothetical protein